jgi:hypothetical protein
MIEGIIAKLREVLNRNENVLLAYLFGSRVGGTGSPVSDYDLAILPERNDLKSMGEIIFTISEALGVNEDLVDVLDLKRAPLDLKVRVLREGIRLVDRGYEDTLIREVNKVYPEIRLEEIKALNWWLKNPEGIDVSLLKERLDYISELAEHVDKLLKRLKPEDLGRDIEAWYALKGMVQDIIQAMIDVCAHVSTAKRLGAVIAYREYVDKLMKAGGMESSLGDDLKLLITLRNRLIHRYLTVTPEELWQISFKLTSTITKKFREWVLSIIR